MFHGISPATMELRRRLLMFNFPDVVTRMIASGIDDPVGLIVDMTDDFGKQLAYAVLQSHGIPTHEIPETIAALSNGATPTLKVIVTVESAMNLLSIISDSAVETLRQSRPAGVHWIVVIAGGGNSYSMISLDLR